MSESLGDPGIEIPAYSLPDPPETANPALADLSPRDKPWDKHRHNADRVEAHYRGSEFDDYSQRVHFCSGLLQFGLVHDWDEDAMKLRLRSARFCRVRYCPVCQWRRSLMWKAKAYKVLPKIVQAYPNRRWVFLTLTVKNVSIAELRENLVAMNKAFQRLSQRKVWPAEGWLRSTEVTRGHDGSAHPHFHCLLMVKPSYFGKSYIKQVEWVSLWRHAMRLDYDPVIDCRAVKCGRQLMQLVPELLKYCTKELDLVSDREWFLELTRQMYKMRCVTTGGVLKEYLRELESEPEDLIGESDIPEGDDEAKLYFGWKHQERKYRMIDRSRL